MTRRIPCWRKSSGGVTRRATLSPVPGIVTVVLVAAILGNVSLSSAWDIQWTDQFGTAGFESVSTAAADATGAYVFGSTPLALPGQSSVGNLDVFLRKYDSAGGVVWTTQFGTASRDSDFDVAVDETGVYVAGQTRGALLGEVSSGGADAFVRKYSRDGQALWTKQFGTAGFDSPLFNGLVAHATGIYITGVTFGIFPGEVGSGGVDVFLAKLDRATGIVIWVRQFGTPGVDLTSTGFGGVAADDTGVYVVANLDLTGSFTSILRKYDFDGGVLWTRVVAQGGCGPVLTGIAAHATGVYVSGQDFDARYEHDGTCPDHRGFPGNVVGVLLKYDAGGNSIWTRVIEGGSQEGNDHFTGAKGVAAFDSGVYVGGNLTTRLAGHVAEGSQGANGDCPVVDPPVGQVFDKFDTYVRRFDFDGNVIWTRQFGGPGFEIVSKVGSDGTGVYAAGQTGCRISAEETFFGGGGDAFVVRSAWTRRAFRD